MANIFSYVNKIKTALYGKDVRGSLANGLEAVNMETEIATALSKDIKQKQNVLETRWDTVVSETTDGSEVIDARVDKDGEVYINLPNRLNALQATAEKAVVTFADVLSLASAQNLKEGMVVGTNGYYSAGDGGAATYLVDSQTTINNEEIIQIQNNLIARLIPIGSSVNYRMFGAIGDGINDDAVQMKKAHDFANKHNIPVVNTYGYLYIKSNPNIDIKTDVDFGKTKIFFDEKVLNVGSPFFNLKSSNHPIEIDLTTIKNTIPFLKKGATSLPPLKGYANSFLNIVDSTTKVGARNGFNDVYWYMEDVTYIDSNGGLIGGISWDFTNVTRITATPCDETTLTIQGGIFLFLGNLGGGKLTLDYSQPLFSNSRSRVVFQNQYFGFQFNQDDATQPFNGYYNIKDCYDVKIINVRAAPRKNVPNGTGNGGYIGSYGIVALRVLNFNIDNLQSISDETVWGVMGCNIIKNFTISNSQTNRIDCHFHAWNVTIKDTNVDRIALTGGGDLIAENTTVSSNRYIDFREDYGAKWDGDITIRNGKLIPNSSDGEVAILYYLPNLNFNYLYDSTFGRKVIVHNFTFDFSRVRDMNKEAHLVRLPYGSSIAGRRIRMPSLYDFKDIFVKGRSKGIEKALFMSSPLNYKLDNPGGVNGDMIKTNCLIRFENVQFAEIRNAGIDDFFSYIFMLNGSASDIYIDEYCIYPRVEFINCGELFITTHGLIADVYIRNCIINVCNAFSGNKGRSRYIFEHCDFQADIKDNGRDACQLATEYGTYLMNCKLHAPTIGGVKRIDRMYVYHVLDLYARIVRFNHINTKISREVMSKYVLEQWYVNALKIHRDTEVEKILPLFGGTSERPKDVNAMYPGFGYFDKTINKMIYRSARNDGWVDGVGTPIAQDNGSI